MKALCWHGKKDVSIDNVLDPEIINDRDVIIKVTATAICGSDLHIYNGLVPSMQSGDVLGHEFMGEVIEVGSGKTKQTLRIGTDRPHTLRETIKCCRKGGTISVPGVYLGMLDNIPFGAFMNKGLTLKSGQTHVQRYLKLLLKKILDGKIDPSQIISHRVKLKDAPKAYETFDDEKKWLY